MENLGKLYTVEEIAEMTSVTSRTIRNYIKKGLLKGRKVGGVWRFTRKDIEDLFDKSTFINKVSEINKQYVYDFLDNKSMDNSTNNNVCTILDYHSSSKQKALDLFNDIMSSFGDDFIGVRIFYEYLESESKARFTIFSDLRLMSEILNLVNSKID